MNTLPPPISGPATLRATETPLMRYPLTLTFKTLAMAPQVRVVDADGRPVFYVRQKLFKFKEAVQVFVDEDRKTEVFRINADRAIDFSARYRFTTPEGAEIGSMRRHGMKSLWRAHYTIFEGQEEYGVINEENPWAKVMDQMLGQLPLVGLLTGYLFHPSYVVRAQGLELMRLTKKPALLEGKFQIDLLVDARYLLDEYRLILSFLMLMLLDRKRG